MFRHRGRGDASNDPRSAAEDRTGAGASYAGVGTAFHTGDHSGGGRALARRLAREGYDLVLVARRRRIVDELAREIIREYRRRVVVLPRDLAATHRLIPEIEAGLAREDITPSSISLIVNNAGNGVHGPFVDETEEELHRRIRLNIDAPAAIIRWGIELFRSSRRSGENAGPHTNSAFPPTICNIASVASFTPGPWMASYYAAKGWLLALGEAIAEEVRNDGIRVVTCCPGPFASDFHRSAGIDARRLGRLPTADRVAGQILRAIHRGRPVAPIGVGPTVWAVVGPRLPRGWSRRLVAIVQRRRFG